MTDLESVLPKKSNLKRNCWLIAFALVFLWSVWGIFVVETKWSNVGTIAQVLRAIARFFPPN